ncbi:NUMOD4 domain-containing protein [Tetragenococcus halophilus]|uniref:NUMOD4 domain-containing protein n=1 Tax=Tetragenococcus halophilus TaxID=51669 RepID=UPI000CC56BF8|nr:NUMOD4 domain-containing protein [Tetragenococcus halophilus]NWO00841.1 endonuclease [Tetragenococcus halophilus]GBD73862.1 hypothetical protein TEHN7125_2022 [Tetragenococcus halophilus subsp. halophilus]GBD76282.1 hypothetical protein TEHN7126_1981 [Tetragenococcus halophilus subsp. halophilus]GMQ74312.1 hypothetical protein TEHSL10_19480 [Tetragenococcus halophilus]
MEIWKDIKGFEGMYQISSRGRVESLERIVMIKGFPAKLKGRELHLFNRKDGYLTASLHNNGKEKRPAVHRLVAEAFIPNKENKAEVNHIDGNKQNNHVENLEWISREDNIKHGYKIGLIPTGERHVNCKLNDKEVKEIRDRYKKENITQYKLADEYGVSQSKISSIVLYHSRKKDTNSKINIEEEVE